MKLDVVIPTRARLGKLLVCLGSIRDVAEDENGHVTVYFASSDELALFSKTTRGEYGWVDQRVFVEYTAPGLWNYHLSHMDADAMMYLNDDVRLHEGAYWMAKSQFAHHFPDTDGVLGMVQENLVGRFDTAPAAFGIIGRKFAQRFPNMQAFCPEYHHLWIDRELEMAAREWGRFYYSTKAKLDHMHPCVGIWYKDDTHDFVRRHGDRDKAIWNERRKRGLVWGPSWELVNLN